MRLRQRVRGRIHTWLRHPAALVVGAFASTIAAGTTLLALPISHRSDIGVSFGDAAFTATSAVTVTGLVVTDTRTVWSPFGEFVLIGLIQAGGLGVMTIAALIVTSVNTRVSVRAGRVAGAELGLPATGGLRRLLRRIVRFVAISEALIALLLFTRFVLIPGTAWQTALHQAVFHSVSAFNNAGFSILDGGLERFVGDWYVNLVVIGAFVLGGIGYPVVFELRRHWRHPRRWSLHTKVTLAMSAALLAVGGVMILATEWSNRATLAAHPFDEKVLAAFFQSATARTAGFNTISIESLRPATMMTLILLMVIGAGSASTGGGIKTSTAAVVIRAMLAEFRGDETTTMFGRAISMPIQRQALALVIAALGTVGTATFVLTVFDSDIATIRLLFEAASAFGTVGISTGITDQIDTAGRLVLIALMFIGRIGPVTFGTAVLTRSEARKFDYPQEPLLVG